MRLRAAPILALLLTAATATAIAKPAAASAPPGYGLLQAARHGSYLRAGARGLPVAALQRALAAGGAALAETGVFEAATEAAVRNFQAAHGARVDGVVGPQTLGAVDRSLGLWPNGIPPQGTNIAPPPGYHPLRGTVPAAVTAKAVLILHGSDPIGTQSEVVVGGRTCIFAVEWHRHPQSAPVPAALKRWHRGVTVYER